MLNAASAGFGLSLIAVGVGLIASTIRRTETVAAPACSPPLTSNQRELPVLSAAQLFEQTGTFGVLATIEAKLGFSREHFQRSVPPVINAYAELVQQLPAAESPRYAKQGGVLIGALEVVDFALTFRRGQILPGGAAPEDIMRLEHRWTYAVFVAALLHDIGKHLAALRVTLHGPGLARPKAWTLLSGSMAESGATQYTVDAASTGEGGPSLHGNFPVSLMQRWVPEDVLQWLSADSALISELMGTLSGERAYSSGAIYELVLRAAAESFKRNHLTGYSKSDAPPQAPHQIAMPIAANDLTRAKNSMAGAEVVASSASCCAGVDRPNGASCDAEEYLDDVEDTAENGKSKSAVRRSKK